MFIARSIPRDSYQENNNHSVPYITNTPRTTDAITNE